ncbi:MAG: hypothetical protein SNJ75_03535 [Gemmataceae bacterium]
MSAFRMQLVGLLVARYTLLGLGFWAIGYGVVVLTVRATLDLDPLPLLWGLATLPLVPVVALLAAVRNLPTPAATRALLDRHSQAGGLLMIRDEADPRDWSPRVVSGPPLRWQAGRLSLLCSIGLAFLVLAFVVPKSFARLGTPRLDVGREAQRLEEQLAVLKQEKILEAQRADELKERLDQVRKDALARDPVKTLEALDFLRDTTQKAASEAAEKTLKQVLELAKAEALAEAVEKIRSKIEPSQLGEALGQLDKLLKKAQADNDLLLEGFDPNLLQDLHKGHLRDEQLKRLAEALKGLKGDKAKKLAKLVKARLIDPDALSKCEKGSQCDKAALARYLKENGCKCDGLCDGDEEGRGGVNEGGGKHKLKFGDETPEHGDPFEEEQLPPSELNNLRDSELQSLSTGSPNNSHKKSDASVSGGALKGAKAGGGSSASPSILPRHRGAVERFFDRPAAANPARLKKD